MSGSSENFMCNEKDLLQSVFSILTLSLAILSNPFENGLTSHLSVSCPVSLLSALAFPAEAAEQGWELPLCIGWLGGQLCTSVAKSKGRGAQLVFTSAHHLSAPCSDL